MLFRSEEGCNGDGQRRQRHSDRRIGTRDGGLGRVVRLVATQQASKLPGNIHACYVDNEGLYTVGMNFVQQEEEEGGGRRRRKGDGWARGSLAERAS